MHVQLLKGSARTSVVVRKVLRLFEDWEAANVILSFFLAPECWAMRCVPGVNVSNCYMHA